MSDNFTQTQIDLIDLLIERGIKRELAPIRKDIATLKYGIPNSFETTTEG